MNKIQLLNSILDKSSDEIDKYIRDNIDESMNIQININAEKISRGLDTKISIQVLTK